MIIYAFGAAIPMLFISYGMRSFFLKYQRQIVGLTERSKFFFGIIMIAVGVFILFGIDKNIEALLLSHLPPSWVDLITKY